MARRRPNAFTLLELVLVMMIIGLALAVVTPSLGGWSRGMRLRAAEDELVAATRFARDRAVTTATLQALTVDPLAHAVHVAPAAPAFVSADNAGRAFTFPQSVTLELVVLDRTPVDRVLFYPDGSHSRAVLRLATDRGEAVELLGDTPGGGFVRRSEEQP